MNRFDPAKKMRATDPFTGTIGDELDRVEVKAGKIGMNSPEEALSILKKLDEIAIRMDSIDNEQSRRIIQTQFDAITTRIEKEASLFLRDLGGAPALRKAREVVNPPEQNRWWYLDETLASRRKATMNRAVVTLGALLVGLLVLVVVYQNFLAPSPEVARRYAHEQAARDRMLTGNLEEALEEVDKGLAYVPQDPVLLINRGVILESLGRDEDARQDYAQAEKGLERPEEFFVTRGQAYTLLNEMEKAGADAAEAIALNPDYAQAYLLSGQVNEMTRNYQQAIIDYEKAYDAAEKSKQLELAAFSRTRLAMMMQAMNVQIEFTEEPESE